LQASMCLVSRNAIFFSLSDRKGQPSLLVFLLLCAGFCDVTAVSSEESFLNILYPFSFWRQHRDRLFFFTYLPGGRRRGRPSFSPDTLAAWRFPRKKLRPFDFLPHRSTIPRSSRRSGLSLFPKNWISRFQSIVTLDLTSRNPLFCLCSPPKGFISSPPYPSGLSFLS